MADAIPLAKAVSKTQWGWVGQGDWNKAVQVIASGGQDGIIRNIDGKIPTYDEAVAMIKQAKGTIDRVEGSHAGSKVAGEIDFPHINYTRQNGIKAHLAIDKLPNKS